MASAVQNVVTKPVTKTVVVEETVTDGVILTLSENEAETLREILYKVGGSPHFSRRGHAESMTKALTDAGVVNPAERLGRYVREGSRRSSTGNIQFTDLPEGDPALTDLPAAPPWMTRDL